MKEALIQIGWGIVEHLRRMIAPFLINMLFGIIMFASSTIELVAVQIVINAVCLVGCLVITFFCMHSAGGSEYKMYEYGEVRRSEHRGEGSAVTISGKYRTSKEYRPWKAVTISLSIVIIPAVLLLLGGTFELTWAQVVLVFLCGWAFYPEYVVYSAVTGTEEIVASSLYYGYIILVLVMAAGIAGYFLGAGKERRRSEMLEQRTRTIERQKRARELAMAEQKRARDRALAEQNRTKELAAERKRQEEEERKRKEENLREEEAEGKRSEGELTQPETPKAEEMEEEDLKATGSETAEHGTEEPEEERK